GATYEDVISAQGLAIDSEAASQSALLRCLVGPPPFRAPPALGASVLAWNGGAVRHPAAWIYEERRGGGLPVLARPRPEAGGGGRRNCWPTCGAAASTPAVVGLWTSSSGRRKPADLFLFPTCCTASERSSTIPL